MHCHPVAFLLNALTEWTFCCQIRRIQRWKLRHSSPSSLLHPPPGLHIPKQNTESKCRWWTHPIHPQFLAQERKDSISDCSVGQNIAKISQWGMPQNTRLYIHLTYRIYKLKSRSISKFKKFFYSSKAMFYSVCWHQIAKQPNQSISSNFTTKES